MITLPMTAKGSLTAVPIDMILHCPKCGTLHVDKPWGGWDNPPHRSHLCDSCEHIWRPCDLATNGVAAILTKGKHDSAPLRRDETALTLHERLADLEAENSALAAGQCVHSRGIIGDDGGTPVCPLTFTPNALKA